MATTKTETTTEETIEHSKGYDSAIKWYVTKKKWSKKMLWNIVGKTLGITAEEYEELTGETYPETWTE